MMLPEAEFPQYVEYHQRDLRAVAAKCRRRLPTLSLRQRAGRSLVRFGRWVEGRYPDLTLEPSPSRLTRSA